MYDPFEARRWGSVALMVLYVPSCSHNARQARGSAVRRAGTGAHRVNLDDRPEPVLGQLGDRREEVPSRACALARARETVSVGAGGGGLGRAHAPQMTKSMRPNFSTVFATASWSCLGCLTSACTARHWLPVAAESSFALSWRRSSL